MYVADRLDKKRFQVDVLSGPQTGIEGSLIEEVRARNIPLVIVPELVREISPWNDIRAFVKITNTMRNKHYDIVHTNSSKAGIIGRWAARIAGVPIIVSLAWGRDELTGAPLPASSGHLMVLVGFDADGNPVVNDPAAPNDAAVRHTYIREEFERIWLERRSGTGYLIYPNDWPASALRALLTKLLRVPAALLSL